MKNLKHIKSAGFKVPKDYFETFEDNLMDEINSKDLNFDVASTGYAVPEGYFNTVEENVTKKLTASADTQIIPLFNTKTLVYISGVAAAILLFFNMFNFENVTAFNNLEIETVENYIIDENISSYEIAALFTDEDLSDDFVEHDFEEENIEEYLLNHADIEALLIE